MFVRSAQYLVQNNAYAPCACHMMHRRYYDYYSYCRYYYRGRVALPPITSSYIWVVVCNAKPHKPYQVYYIQITKINGTKATSDLYVLFASTILYSASYSVLIYRNHESFERRRESLIFITPSTWYQVLVFCLFF